MSNDAQVAFEHGKSLFEEENFSEAVSAFAKVVRLEPQNAEYHAWLARALTGDNEFSKAMEEVTRAIQLDPAS